MKKWKDSRIRWREKKMHFVVFSEKLKVLYVSLTLSHLPC